MTTKIFRKELRGNKLPVEKFNLTYIQKMADIYYGNPREFLNRLVEHVSICKQGPGNQQKRAFDAAIQAYGFTPVSLRENTYTKDQSTRISFKDSYLRISHDSASDYTLHDLCVYIDKNYDGKRLALLTKTVVNALPEIEKIRAQKIPMNQKRAEKILKLQTTLVESVLKEYVEDNLKIYHNSDEIAVYFSESYGKQLSFDIPLFAKEAEIRKIIKEAIKDLKMLSKIKRLYHPTLEGLQNEANYAIGRVKCQD